MKKILLFMSAVAMFAASSCNKVEINEPQIETPSVNVSGDATQFVAYTESATKTALNGLETVWEAGDVIDINEIQYITTEGGARAIFTIDKNSYEPDEIPEAPVAPFMAGYPYNSVYGNNTPEDATLCFNFSNSHILNAGEISSEVLAVAYSKSEPSLEFKNVVSLLKFSVPEFAEDIKEIRISANEPLAGDIAVNYNEGKPTWAIDGDASFNELVLTPSSGNFVAGDDYYAPVLPGQKTNLTFKINDKVVATGISMELKRNVIHYIATLPAAPKWAIAGTFNNWNASATPMAKDGDFFVAKGITGLNYTAKSDGEGSDTGFKFVVNGGDWKGSVGEIAAGAWEYVWDAGNGSNIYVKDSDATTAYDIYVNPSAGNNGKFVIVPAGSEMPKDVPAWAIAGTFNDWIPTATPMVKEGDFYVAKNVSGLNYTEDTEDGEGSSTGFKFVTYGTDWKGSVGEVAAGSWEYVWDTGNGDNIYVKDAASSTLYDIYVNPAEGNNGKFVIVPAGGEMPEDKPAEEPEVTETTVYFKPNKSLTLSAKSFAAWVWSDTISAKWYTMIDSDSDGVYEVTIPNTLTSIIFAAMNSTTADWNNKIYQTADLSVPTNDNNCYLVATDKWVTLDYAKAYVEQTPYRFYVQNKTTHKTIAFYTWGGTYTNGWPGDVMSNTAEVPGYGTCCYVEIPYGKTIVNFIINNNNNGKQTANLDVSKDAKKLDSGDYIYVLSKL